MAKIDSISSAKRADSGSENATPIDIEGARIALSSNGEALSAIANAVEVLSSLDPKPKALFSHTITRLMSHVVYLADSLGDEIGSFIDTVEEAKEVSHV